MKIYLKGGKGIENPVDFNGYEIEEGDILTGDYFDNFFSDDYYNKNYPEWSKEDIQKHKNKALYKVKWNVNGYFYAEGIKEPTSEFSGRLYLHDFRFKYTKKINS